MTDAQPVAVVVGLCGHGLALTRSLAKAGVEVIALEANRSLPGVTTATANVKFVEDINGPGLIDALRELAKTLSDSPVLLLTNDTMIATVGARYDDLRDLYQISWGSARTELLPLLQKEPVRERCSATGLHHPQTRMIDSFDTANECIGELSFPIIFKPNRPVSPFKTLVVEDAAQLQAARPVLETGLPAVMQEFVPGDDTSIRFGALYLDRGRVVARFEGRKLRSRPMGHTTVAVAEANDAIHELALQFFDGLELSGPVSLELKAGPDGRQWVIEPTVGRTDFWVGLCIADGVDLPFIEYAHQVGGYADAYGDSDGEKDSDKNPTPTVQNNRTLWVNEERDPGALFWVLMNHRSALVGQRITGVFAHLADYRPGVAWVGATAKALPGRVAGKLRKMMSLSSER